MEVLVPAAGHPLADLAAELSTASGPEDVAATGVRAAARLVGDVAGISLAGDAPPIVFPGGPAAAQTVTAILGSAREPSVDGEPLTVPGQAGGPSAVLCPLRAGDAPLGYLALARTGSDRRYTEAELDLARDVAGEVALALGGARSRELLRASEEYCRQLVETAQEGVWQLDRDAVTTSVNQRMADLLGLPREEVPGQSARAFLAERDHTNLLRFLAAAAEGEHPVHRTRLVRADGVVRSVQLAATPLPGPGGWLCTVVDVTDQEPARGLKRQLDHLRRLDSLGQLIGGIAHDFNNLFTVVAGSAEVIADEAEPGSTPHRLAAGIVQATVRGRELAHQLLAFGRTGGVSETVTVSDLLASVTHLLARTLGEHIKLELDVDAEVWPVRTERGPLEQVLVNLAANARDAMTRGGVLTISAANTTVEPGRFEDETCCGPFVRITVADTGTGMDPQTRARAFEPFFTTKPTAAGLGLATAAGIVRGCGGYIRLESVPRMGTTVEVYLPAGTARTGPGAAPAPAAAGHGHILVVEDQPELAQLIRRLLESGGYTVTVATDPEAAMTCLPPDVRPDLLLTDVVMPGMNGPDLAAALRARYPGMGVVYTSGYAPATLGPQSSIQDDNLLQKPFTRDELLAAVRNAWSAPEA